MVATPLDRVKRPFVRRASPDRSQHWRRAFQLAFLALNVWIAVQFYLWVRYYETAGRTARVTRPPGVEGWLPIASLMNLKYLIMTGEAPPIHAAGMYLLIAFLMISLAARKTFCSWLCPIGTISEWLMRLGRATFGRNFALPRWVDIPLRSLKYLLLGLFLYAVGSMSAAEIRAFLEGPYGLVADVKMLNFFRYLDLTAAVTLALLVVASVFVANFWCRYLCPYGALLGLVSLLSPLRIRRNEARCIDCAKCAIACPSVLPVDKLVQVRSAECTGCLECVAICPAQDALAMVAQPKRVVPDWAMAAAIVAIFLGVYAYALWAGQWHTHLPEAVLFDLIPRAQEFSHP